MSLTLVGLLVLAFSAYSYFLVRRAGYLQHAILIPFLYRVHTPNVMETITDEEHDLIHDQIDRFNLRILACFFASIIAIGVSLMFLILIQYEGDARWAGYIMAFLFAFLGANYNLNTSIEKWVSASEAEILNRVLHNKMEEGGHETLADYLHAENEKMIREAQEEMQRLVEEFEEIAVECGWDPEKDYEETEETLEEFFEIMDKAQQKINEKYPEPSDK